MVYHLLANLTILVHFAFLLFVVLGGFVSHRYRRLTPLHLLALAWGIYVEAMPGLRCPLTALENSFAVRAGGAGYEGGFIQHYLVPILYPEGLTPRSQLMIAAALVLLNVGVYAWSFRRSFGQRPWRAA